MTETSQLNEALAANYMLVDLEIRSWSGRSTDRSASDEVIVNRSAVKGSGKFIKNLFAGADAELKDVGKKAQMVREFVYSHTLPFSANSEGAKRGARLLAATNSIEFLRELNDVKREYDTSVAALAAVWDARKAQSIINLGGLADVTDYPDTADVVGLFGIVVALNPVPSQNDFQRINIPAPLAKALGQRHAEAAQLHVDVALGELKERLLECVGRMSTQLGKAGNGEKTRLYDSLVSNLQSLVGLTRSMNVVNNPGITELADRIERELLANPVDVFRASPAKAAEVANAAVEIAKAAAVDEIWKVL